jgi:REP element-mobilizing transposase RayT
LTSETFSSVVGYIKGKSAIAVARQFGGKQKNFNGERFWARGYAVSTVGFEEAKIKEYIAKCLSLSIDRYLSDRYNVLTLHHINTLL